MTARRMLRSGVVLATIVASVLLLGAAATPPPVPDDPADPVRASEYWLDGARIRDAWQTTRGDGVTIAVIDTGIGKVPGVFDGAVTDGTDVSGTGSPDGRTPVGAIDGNHGSWVASLAAGRGAADGKGMIGVAPEADLLSISVGFGAAAAVPFTEQVAKAMRWAVDNGADIINLSFTTNTLDWDKSWDDAFLYAFEHDVVVVVAAGNRGSGTDIIGAPATIPGVLTVGGVDQTGTASLEASTQGITIGIAAPSEGLLGVSADGTVVSWRGTSGAAPIVAGIAALIRSAHPDLDAANVINRIIKTAIPVEGMSKTPDPLYGYGLIDAEAALNADLPSVAENPMGDLAEWVRLYRRAETVPQPVPTATPVTVPPLPDADAPTEAGSPLLPSAESLRYGTLPLIALTVPGILIALGVTAAARRIRSARIRTPHS
ncbi:MULTISPECIES: S8 family serine peptidase [Microbacterium]|uniref:S8 family serine peptidase n=1 Tax=Microbacterium TaxID=33882 RepID=UPI0011EF80D5|nr:MULTISPECIES: S8 family serine peptidase [Microbacterium]KAA0961530.1 S8 family serine peptidase [Microbacterium sp. ANT_H45B]MCP1429356.1 subtilisin family serine protease [Microbacterium foliorum]